MPILNKTKRTAAIYNRGREVVKVYDHGTLAWQKQTSIPDYLCFTALESGTFTLTIPAAVTATYLSYIEWSKDGRTWNHTDNTSEAVTIPVSVTQGEKVYWRGSGVCMNDSTHASTDYCSVFTQTEDTPNFVVSGNLVSLIALSDFDYEVIKACAFANLFFGNEKLTDAENLILPMFSAGATYLFYRTFKNCSNLAKAPILNLTRTTRNCCFEMFMGTALTTMPELPNVALSNYCYSGMFRETNIEKAVLPSSATTLVTSCYSNIFNGCTHLNYVKCLATDISATNCLSNWLQNVSSTGTFIQAEGVEWPRGASGIPTGWVDVEKRTMPSGYKQVEYLRNPNYGYISINRAFEANAETLEVAFVKQATGASMPFGSSIHNYRYGSVKVTEQATALAVNVGIDFDNQVNKIVSIASVTADTPRTLRYEGNASGFEVYLDGVSKSTQTCAWDAVNPFVSNMVFSASTNTSSTAYFHVLPVYYLKIWNGNGVLALDYVAAVRESDGVAGFYDMTANTFHKSDNANDFTAGEEI